jgi:pectinesterase
LENPAVFRYSWLLVFLVLSPSWVGAEPVQITVAADGSGQFTKVQDAIMSVPDGRPERPVIIHIKPGTYKERLYIQREKRFFHLVGDDPATTILTFDLNANLTDQDGTPIGTFRTPSTVVDADDFTAENLTFENSAGPVGQALAVRVEGDRAVFRNCHFLGWQDTILVNRGRQLFERCLIKGHVDFIFGGATAYFDRCHIHCLGNGYITAASTPDFQQYGFVFRDCRITSEPKMLTYLGRPWRGYSAVTFINTEMSETVRPEGWNNWGQPERELTSRYYEFGSTGPGGEMSQRVKWAKQLTPEAAAVLTREHVLAGLDGWKPPASQ